MNLGAVGLETDSVLGEGGISLDVDDDVAVVLEQKIFLAPIPRYRTS